MTGVRTGVVCLAGKLAISNRLTSTALDRSLKSSYNHYNT
jgi:hypothetical protein